MQQRFGVKLTDRHFLASCQRGQQHTHKYTHLNIAKELKKCLFFKICVGRNPLFGLL